jgi:hypothetical protein
MHYQISRDGQTYGPYTLEDLGRYVASGNVLPTDMAKSETMSEWLTVEQILANAANAAPSEPAPSAYVPVANVPVQPNPAPYTGMDYGATPNYGTTPTLATSPYPDPPNLHWGLVLLFTLLTCGLFMPIWNLVVNLWLKKVQPNTTALYYLVGYIGLTLVQAFLSVPDALYKMAHPHELRSGSSLGVLIGIAAWVLKLIWRFTERTSLEEHFNGPEPIGLRLDSIMTFFFGGLYFQSKLNEINEMKQRARFSAQRPY